MYITRRAGSIQFDLVQRNLSKEQFAIFTEDDLVTLDCTLHLFNVLEASERTLCMDMLEADISGEGS